MLGQLVKHGKDTTLGPLDAQSGITAQDELGLATYTNTGWTPQWCNTV